MIKDSIHVFQNVWFRRSVAEWSDLKLIAYDDVGTLSVAAHQLEFLGKKIHLIIHNIDLITYGCHGRDFVNHWIKIDYNGGQTSLIADGKWLGWGGQFGGTRRLLDAIKANYVFND